MRLQYSPIDTIVVCVCVCICADVDMCYQFQAITIQSILIDWNGFGFWTMFWIVIRSLTAIPCAHFFLSLLFNFAVLTDWQPTDNKPFNWLQLFTLSQSNSKQKKSKHIFSMCMRFESFLGWFFTFDTTKIEKRNRNSHICKHHARSQITMQTKSHWF